MIDYEAIKSRITISEILSKYGFNPPDRDRYHILCPWHQERTASLSVDNRKGLFNCFGCGSAGSVIDLVARLDRISAKEAAQNLASEFSISDASRFIIDARKISSQISELKPVEIRTIDVPFDLRELPSGYRDLSRRAIDHFSLSLADHGVFIPHYDLSGNIIGYSVRRPDGVKPKYLNSVKFPRDIPYGIYQNKEEIIRRGFAIVVEGQLDAITLWDRGYPNVISVMGSSMMEAQAHLLLGLTTHLVLLFDGDRPGIIGAARTNRRWNRCFSIRVELLPDGKDPAEWLAETGIDV